MKQKILILWKFSQHYDELTFVSLRFISYEMNHDLRLLASRSLMFDGPSPEPLGSKCGKKVIITYVTQAIRHFQLILLYRLTDMKEGYVSQIHNEIDR